MCKYTNVCVKVQKKRTHVCTRAFTALSHYLPSTPSECSRSAPKTLQMEKPPLLQIMASARPSGVHFKALTEPQTVPQSECSIHATTFKIRTRTTHAHVNKRQKKRKTTHATLDKTCICETEQFKGSINNTSKALFYQRQSVAKRMEFSMLFREHGTDLGSLCWRRRACAK